jgi:hypothetical protein
MNGINVFATTSEPTRLLIDRRSAAHLCGMSVAGSASSSDGAPGHPTLDWEIACGLN